MNLLDLPIEILAIITTADLDTFLAALKAPGIGPKLCCEYIQNYAKSIFIKIVDDMWYTQYYLDGELHRRGGPAMIRKGGWTHHCQPFIQKYNSPEEYTTDKPTYDIGILRYYKNKRSLIYVQEIQAYYIRGKLHNSLGPAKIYEIGAKEFWTNGTYMYTIDAHGEKYTKN